MTVNPVDIGTVQFRIVILYGVSLDCHTRIPRKRRKTTAEEPSSSCVHCTCWWLLGIEGNIMKDLHRLPCLPGSGTYLECSGYSIANIQSPSESKMVLYCRKKYCQPIQPLRHYAQGGCRKRRFCLTGAWYNVPVRAVQNTPWKFPKYIQISWNWLALREPRIQSCCPQPPTAILSACHLSSMYSSAEATSTVTYWKHCEAFKSSPQWLCEFHRP